MKTVNVNSVRVGFKLTSVKLDLNRCNVRVSFEDDQNGYRDKLLKNVSITSLLAERIKSRPDIYKIGEWCESLNTSADAVENPYQLIMYYGSGGSRKYLLCPVFQRTSKRYEEVYPDGRVVTTFRNRSHSKAYYKRFRDAYSNKAKQTQVA